MGVTGNQRLSLLHKGKEARPPTGPWTPPRVEALPKGMLQAEGLLFPVLQPVAHPEREQRPLVGRGGAPSPGEQPWNPRGGGCLLSCPYSLLLWSDSAQRCLGTVPLGAGGGHGGVRWAPWFQPPGLWAAGSSAEGSQDWQARRTGFESPVECWGMPRHKKVVVRK